MPQVPYTPDRDLTTAETKAALTPWSNHRPSAQQTESTSAAEHPGQSHAPMEPDNRGPRRTPWQRATPSESGSTPTAPVADQNPRLPDEAMRSGNTQATDHASDSGRERGTNRQPANTPTDEAATSPPAAGDRGRPVLDKNALPKVKAAFTAAFEAAAEGDNAQLEALRAAIQQIRSPDQQLVLRLRYFGNLTFAEIADETGGFRSENATKHLHHRGVQALAKILDAEDNPDAKRMTPDELLETLAAMSSREKLEEEAARTGWRDTLVSELRHAILSERLPEGRLLPPAIDLAARLGISSEKPVATAYQRLASEGYLSSRTKAGTWVAGRDRWPNTGNVITRILPASVSTAEIVGNTDPSLPTGSPTDSPQADAARAARNRLRNPLNDNARTPQPDPGATHHVAHEADNASSGASTVGAPPPGQLPEGITTRVATPAPLEPQTPTAAQGNRTEEAVTHAALLRHVLPPGVHTTEIFGNEHSSTLNLRRCTEQALQDAGFAGQPIPTGPDGEPLLPGELIVATAQANEFTGVVVAEARTVRAIGLDAKNHVPLRSNLLLRTTQSEERYRMRDLMYAHPAVHWDQVHVSAKDNVLDLHSRLTGNQLRHNQVEITLHLDATDATTGTFEAQLPVDNPAVVDPTAATFSGRFRIRNGVVVTAITLRHEDGRGLTGHADDPSDSDPSIPSKPTVPQEGSEGVRSAEPPPRSDLPPAEAAAARPPDVSATNQPRSTTPWNRRSASTMPAQGNPSTGSEAARAGADNKQAAIQKGTTPHGPGQADHDAASSAHPGEPASIGSPAAGEQSGVPPENTTTPSTLQSSDEQTGQSSDVGPTPGGRPDPRPDSEPAEPIGVEAEGVPSPGQAVVEYRSGDDLDGVQRRLEELVGQVLSGRSTEAVEVGHLLARRMVDAIPADGVVESARLSARLVDGPYGAELEVAMSDSRGRRVAGYVPLTERQSEAEVRVERSLDVRRVDGELFVQVDAMLSGWADIEEAGRVAWLLEQLTPDLDAGQEGWCFVRMSQTESGTDVLRIGQGRNREQQNTWMMLTEHPDGPGHEAGRSLQVTLAIDPEQALDTDVMRVRKAVEQLTAGWPEDSRLSSQRTAERLVRNDYPRRAGWFQIEVSGKPAAG